MSRARSSRASPRSTTADRRSRRSGLTPIAVASLIPRMRLMATEAEPMSDRPKRAGVPEGLWLRCPNCKAMVYKKEVEARLHVCPECDHHFAVPAKDRIAQLLDADSFEEWLTKLRP